MVVCFLSLLPVRSLLSSLSLDYSPTSSLASYLCGRILVCGRKRVLRKPDTPCFWSFLQLEISLSPSSFRRRCCPWIRIRSTSHRLPLWLPLASQSKGDSVSWVTLSLWETWLLPKNKTFSSFSWSPRFHWFVCWHLWRQSRKYHRRLFSRFYICPWF